MADNSHSRIQRGLDTRSVRYTALVLKLLMGLALGLSVLSLLNGGVSI